MDLDRFTYSLKARYVTHVINETAVIYSIRRLTAEEAYMQALIKITKTNYSPENSVATATSTPLEKHNYFGDYTTTFQQTTMQYENSIEKTIELRRDYIACLKSQIELLSKVKVCLYNCVCIYMTALIRIQHERNRMNKEEKK